MSFNKEDTEAVLLIDVDGTALSKEGDDNGDWETESWFLLTVAFGADRNEHKRIYGEYLSGITHHPEKDKHLHDKMASDLIGIWLEAWKKKGWDHISREDLGLVCEIIKEKISQELKDGVEKLIANNILVVMGTGGFELAAKAISEALGLEEQIAEDGDELEFWFGNTKFIFKDDVLLTFEHDKDVPGTKFRQAQEKMAEITQIIGREVPVITVGDGFSDLALFIYYQMGIAFRQTDDKLMLAARASADNWEEVVDEALKLLGKTTN